MKRIAIISLVVIFLTANYTYATFPIEELSNQIENTQGFEELPQEEVEEMFVVLMSLIDLEALEKLLSTNLA